MVVVIDMDDVADVPDLVSLAGYRVVQEAFTNAARHGTGRVELAVRRRPGALVIDVVNPVAGDPPADGDGYGLLGMRERVDAADGHLRIERSGGSFRVHVTLPLEPDHNVEGARP
jgi:signal transduction histidine kinase